MIVGTAAFAEDGALGRFASALGDALVVAIDCRDGRIAVRGWGESTGLAVEEALDRCVAAGVVRLHCTAIDRDGTLAGPDLPLLRRVVERSRLAVVAAGGVSSEADLDAIEQTGCEGAVVGRALLEGRVPLSAIDRR